MLTVLGASHHDLELTQLERLAARTEELSSGLAALCAREDSPVAGLVLVSTCNRLEIYVDALRFHDAIDAVGDVVADSVDRVVKAQRIHVDLEPVARRDEHQPGHRRILARA